MKGDNIPPTDHVLRYVKPAHIETDDDGNPIILGSGFIARPQIDNKGVSYNWLECLSASAEESVQKVRELARIKYAASAKLVRLNVEKVCQCIVANTDDSRVIAVIEDPLEADAKFPEDLSHALMTNIPDENDVQRELIGDLISRCFDHEIDIFPARAAATK